MKTPQIAGLISKLITSQQLVVWRGGTRLWSCAGLALVPLGPRSGATLGGHFTLEDTDSSPYLCGNLLKDGNLALTGLAHGDRR